MQTVARTNPASPFALLVRDGRWYSVDDCATFLCQAYVSHLMICPPVQSGQSEGVTHG